MINFLISASTFQKLGFKILQLVTTATFQVQELKFNFVSSTYHLNVMCVNALGANKSCEIEVVDETERVICEFTGSPEE